VKRAPSFGRKQRSRLARRAATARWARLGRGVLTLAEIRAVVVEALGERKAKAYLFGSYARGDACAPQILRADLEMAGLLCVLVPQGTRTGENGRVLFPDAS
jgi:hypothetical protein